MANIFVYGTLRKGEPNHWMMDHDEIVFIREDVLPGYEKYFKTPNNTGLSFIRPAEEASVEGELYQIPDNLIPRFDTFEGHPNWYRRTDVSLKSGEKAFVYAVAPRG
mgnify:CR=1 FL=1